MYTKNLCNNIPIELPAMLFFLSSLEIPSDGGTPVEKSMRFNEQSLADNTVHPTYDNKKWYDIVAYLLYMVTNGYKKCHCHSNRDDKD